VVSADPRPVPPGVARPGEGGGYAVDARGAMGVQVGEGATQINYYYSERTYGDGVVAPPLVSVSGAIDSPYRGLSAFEEHDAAFFFGREAATTQVLERMSRQLDGAGLLVVSGVSGGQASPRCCGQACCRGCGGQGWHQPGARRPGPACCSPLAGRPWTSWRLGWRGWPERTPRRCGEVSMLTRSASR
jgi:hypothetical protein